jgi:sialic acid synthase SpsE
MKGDDFSPANVTAKRPGGKRSPMEYWDLMGRIAERNYNADDWL